MTTAQKLCMAALYLSIAGIILIGLYGLWFVAVFPAVIKGLLTCFAMLYASWFGLIILDR
jgi:hypothetical protein